MHAQPLYLACLWRDMATRWNQRPRAAKGLFSPHSRLVERTWEKIALISHAKPRTPRKHMPQQLMVPNALAARSARRTANVGQKMNPEPARIFRKAEESANANACWLRGMAEANNHCLFAKHRSTFNGRLNMQNNKMAFGWCVLFLVSVSLGGTGLANETESKDGMAMTVAAQSDGKADAGKEKCPPGAPCASHAATGGANDTASDGSTCTSGSACNDTTAHCGTGNAGTCTTVPYGGGMCKCLCAMP